MKHHYRYETVFRGKSGKIFTTKAVENLMTMAYPDFNIGSNRPNDHGEGNDCPCECAKNGKNRPIFDRVKVGLYRVR